MPYTWILWGISGTNFRCHLSCVSYIMTVSSFSKKVYKTNRSQNADCWCQSSKCSRSKAARFKWKQMEEHQSSLLTTLPRKIPSNAGEPPLKDRHITPPWGTATKDIFKLLQSGSEANQAQSELVFFIERKPFRRMNEKESVTCYGNIMSFLFAKKLHKTSCFFVAFYWWLPICFFQHHVSYIIIAGDKMVESTARLRSSSPHAPWGSILKETLINII